MTTLSWALLEGFASVLLKRPRDLEERVYSESPCGFRANRSSVDMVSSIRQLHEKYWEQRLPVFVVSLELNKAFDTVSTILQNLGCPPRLLSIIKSFHPNMTGTTIFSGSTSESFKFRSSSKLGWVFDPAVFGIFSTVLLKHTFGLATECIYFRTRSDGKLNNLRWLKTKSKY